MSYANYSSYFSLQTVQEFFIYSNLSICILIRLADLIFWGEFHNVILNVLIPEYFSIEQLNGLVKSDII